MIKGRLCSLRPILTEDLELIRQWRLSDLVHPNFPSWDIITPSSQELWYQAIINSDSCCYFLIEDIKGVRVGVIYLIRIDRRNRHAEFGYYLGVESALNSGIAIEAELLILDYAFGYLNFHKIYCESMAFNKGVLNIHKRFGFRQDGILRNHVFRNGSYHDMVIMSILNDEFLVSRDNISKVLEDLASR